MELVWSEEEMQLKQDKSSTGLAPLEPLVPTLMAVQVPQIPHLLVPWML